MSTRLLLRLINGGLSLAYLAFGFAVIWRALSSAVSPMGGLLVAGLAIALAIGHLMLKRWAIKSSAAISLCVTLLMIPYLIGGFDQELVPQFSKRLFYSSVVAVLAAFMLTNYWLYDRSASQLENGEHR